jgi:hypothetical protein
VLCGFLEPAGVTLIIGLLVPTLPEFIRYFAPRLSLVVGLAPEYRNRARIRRS